MVRTPSVGAAAVKVLTVANIGGRWWAVAVADDAVCVWPVGGPPDSGRLVRTKFGLRAAVLAGGCGEEVIVGLQPMDTMWRWRLSTGELLGTDDPLGPFFWEANPRSGSPAASIDNAGASLVVTAVGAEHSLRAWDPLTGAQVGAAWQGHREKIVAVAAVVLADGTPLVVSGDLDGEVRRWDARTGRDHGPPLHSWDGPVELATARLPDGRTAVCVTSRDATLHRFEATSGQPLGPPIDLGWRPDNDSLWYRPTRLACLPTAEGAIMLTTIDNGTVEVRDLIDGQVRSRVDTGPTMWAVTAASLDDGTPIILAADYGGHVRRFHALTATRHGAPMTPFSQPVYQVLPILDPAGGVVLAATLEGGVCRFDAATGRPIDDPADPLPAFGTPQGIVAIPGRGPMLVSADDVAIYRVDLTTRTAVEPGPIDEDQDGWGDVTVVPLPDGRVIIAAGRDDGKVYRWDAATGDPLPALTGHTNIVTAVTTATTADGTPMIVSVSEAGDVRRWHAETGEPIGAPWHAPEFDNGDLAVVRHGDGRQVLICACRFDGTVYQWDPITAQPTGPTFTVDSWAAALLSAYVNQDEVPYVVIAILDNNYDTLRVERWRLDTASKVDELPDTTRAAFLHADVARMVLANGDGSLTVTKLPVASE
jgi:WD40 repeat protein